MIEKALIFATIAHEGQKRKGSDIPYILHPMEAGAIVLGIKYDEELITAAILHDIIEDTAFRSQDIEERFGKRVLELVTANSEDKSRSWEERKTATIQGLKNETDYGVLIVTLADKLSNMRQIHRDYYVMGEKLWERFNRGYEEQKWYYGCLVDGLQALEGLPEYKEFKRLYEEVFGK
jgi:(p)ppGpp synthase/HD superfamily hydrolase